MASRFWFESEAEAERQRDAVRARGGKARVYRRDVDGGLHACGDQEVRDAAPGAVVDCTEDDAPESERPAAGVEDRQVSVGVAAGALMEQLRKAVAGAGGQQAWPLGGGWWAMRREVFARAVGDRGGRQLLVDAGVLCRGGGSAGTVVVQRRGQMERVYKVRLSQGG